MLWALLRRLNRAGEVLQDRAGVERLAVVGLLAWALRTAANSSDGEAEGLSDGGGGLGVPPPEPRPVTPNGGLPLDGSNPPRRRLRAGERLSELHPMPARRDREPHRPERVPAQR